MGAALVRRSQPALLAGAALLDADAGGEDRVTDRITISDIETALQLRATGEPWRRIGIIVAKRKGRTMVYRGHSMHRACRPFMEDAESPASKQEK